MFSKESNFIRRTSAPKYSNYISDGCGRDKYILANNGGFLRRTYSNVEYKTSTPGKYYEYNCFNRESRTSAGMRINWEASNME